MLEKMPSIKKKPTPTPKPLVGAAAVKEYQRQVSAAGMAAAEARARAAINNRYGNKSTSGNSVLRLVNKVRGLGK
jgi:hypothetical protein